LYAQGIDERPVVASRVRQQISKEITFDQDLYLSACHDAWQVLAEKVWASLEKRQLSAFGVSIKLKQPDFQIVQHSKRFQSPWKTLPSYSKPFCSYSPSFNSLPSYVFGWLALAYINSSR
jgi:DNA polymerase-4